MIFQDSILETRHIGVCMYVHVEYSYIYIYVSA